LLMRSLVSLQLTPNSRNFLQTFQGIPCCFLMSILSVDLNHWPCLPCHHHQNPRLMMTSNLSLDLSFWPCHPRRRTRQKASFCRLSSTREASRDHTP
jgi:hypothetical protein